MMVDKDDQDHVKPSPSEPEGGDSTTKESSVTPVDTFSAPDDEKKGAEEIENLDKVFGGILRELRRIGSNTNYNFYGPVTNSAVGTDSQVNIDQQKISRETSGSLDNNKSKPKIEQFKTIDNVRKWFFDKQVVEQTFILAVTFFSGSSLQFVISASDGLQEILGVVKKVEDDAKTSIFGNSPSIDELLNESFTKTHTTSLNTEMGLTAYQSVVFQDQKLYSLFTDFIRNNNNFIKILPSLRTWLLDIINSNNHSLLSMGAPNSEIVKTQAALGIGFLARNEFSMTLNSILKPWATSDDPYKRLMVGWALLGYLDGEDGLELRWPNILSLLKHWSSVDNYRLQWTSIITTTRLGLLADNEHSVYLEESLGIIKTICQGKQVGLFKSAISKSLRLLFSLSPYHAETVIMELASWLHEKNNVRLPDLAAELFVVVVDQKLDFDHQNNETVKSKLIWDLCEPDKKIFGAVYALSKQVFLHNKGSFVDFAMDKMVDWINTASRHGSEKKLVYLLRKLYIANESSQYISLVLNSERIKDPKFRTQVVE